MTNRKEQQTHDDPDPRIRSPHRPHERRITIQNTLHVPLPDINVVSAEHELHDVRLRGLDPSCDVVARDVIGLPPGVAFVVRVEAGRPLAVGLEGRHGADEVDGVGEVGADELGPDERAPAGEFGYRVAEEHCVGLDSVGLGGWLWVGEFTY